MRDTSTEMVIQVLQWDELIDAIEAPAEQEGDDGLWAILDEIQQCAPIVKN